jgi:uncharacterized membrane protein
VVPWWLRIFGVHPPDLRPQSQLELTFTHLPQSWGWLVLLATAAAGVYAVFHLYRRELDTCPRRVQTLLALLRAAVLLLLALIFLGPAVQTVNRETVKPYLVLLLDDSLSMTDIHDAYPDEAAAARVAAALGADVGQVRQMQLSRAEVVDRALRQPLPATPDRIAEPGLALPAALARHCDVRVFHFASALWEPVPNPGAAPAASTPDLAAVRQGTNIAKAIRDAAARLRDKKVQAMVLISDGQITEGQSAGEMFSTRPESDPRAERTPVFTVGVGDESQPRSVRVAEVRSRDTAWKGEALTVEAQIEARGLGPNETVRPQLVVTPADAVAGTTPAGEILVPASPDQQTLRFPGGSGEATVLFEYTPRQVGRLVLRVQVDPSARVLRPADGARTIQVQVIDAKARVLLVAGTPTWDYQLLRSLLLRDKNIDLSCWLQSLDLDLQQEGSTPIKDLPATPETLFPYDVVILLDPNPQPDYNPNEFNPEWMQLLQRYVGEHAGGLLYMAGPAYASSFLTRTQSQNICDLLPVTFDDLSLTEAADFTSSFDRPLAVEPTAEGLDHPALMFFNDFRRNQDLWHDVPGLYWCLPCKLAKPAAKTLLVARGADPAAPDQLRPIMVAGQYGAGRTVWMGFDGSWRWRRLGHDSEYFDKFWTQTIHFLIDARRLGNQQRGRIKLDSQRVGQGRLLKFSALALDPSYKPLLVKTLTAVLEDPAGRSESIEMVPAVADPSDPAAKTRLGWYTGQITPTQLGPHELTIALDGGATLRRTLQVIPPQAEFDDPRLDRVALTQIAQKTGGRYFDIDQLARLADPQVLPDQAKHPESRPNPAALWDTGRMLILLVTLLSVEWAVRKHFKLM